MAETIRKTLPDTEDAAIDFSQPKPRVIVLDSLRC